MRGASSPPQPPSLAAVLHEPKSGRVMELHTDAPGVQLYVGARPPGAPLGDCHSAAPGRRQAARRRRACRWRQRGVRRRLLHAATPSPAGPLPPPLPWLRLGNKACTPLPASAGGFLDAEPGKDGATYRRHGGLCLETQTFPDGINQPGFPSPVLKAGELYFHTMARPGRACCP